MSSRSVKKRILDFYKRQQFRLKNKEKFIKIEIRTINPETKGLSLWFATLCVIDLFGVFPIIALPAALISCGCYGILLLLFVITLQIYTAVILGRCWVIAEKLHPEIVQKSRYPYAAVAELIYGKKMRLFVTILLDLTVFGGGIPNLLVASQNMELLGNRISNGNFYFSFCYWLIVIGLFLCPIMWLGSPKNMKTLASISVVICSTVAILIWWCIINDEFNELFKPFDGIKFGMPNFQNLLKTYGLIAFQFDIHPMLLTIEVDMQNKQRIGHAVSYGIIFTCLMSITTTLIAAHRYGNNITPNVLEILPRSNLLYLAIMLVTLQLCLSSAVGNSALFQHIEDLLKISRKFNLKRCFVRSLLIGLAVLIGELVPKFDLVMSIIGGTLTGPLIFILPPLFYSKISKMEDKFDLDIRNSNLNVNNDESDENEDDADDDVDDEDHFVDDINDDGYGTFNRQQQQQPQQRRRRPKSLFVSNRNKLSKGQRCYNISKNILKFMYSDCVLSIAVIAFGLIATFASTYFSITHVNNLESYWSPCVLAA